MPNKEVLYFTASWCSPCKKMRPMVEEINNSKGQLQYKIIDVDSNVNLVDQYQIKSVPTFIVLEDSIESKRLIGIQSKETLESLVRYE